MAETEKQLATVTRTGPVRERLPDVADAADVSLKVRDPRRYEFIEEHGRGGLGRVMRTRDLDLGREVAVKEILDPSGVDEVRFVREALITARLEHPGIVPVHDAGRWPNGTPFYSMKLVSGRSLKDVLSATASLEERLALLPHIIAVADALAYAHDRRIIHRDLKPANIIIGAFGETVVIDWGLAKDLSSSEKDLGFADAGPYRTAPDNGLTNTGAVMGTPAYMPPEQAGGEQVDERSDVYALGAVLYHLLAGKPPYADTDSPRVLVALRERTRPERVGTILRKPTIAASELIAIAEKAMAPDADNRYGNARPLADDLRRFQNGQLVHARQYDAYERVIKWVLTHRSLVYTAAVAVVALSALGAVAFKRIVAERARAEQSAALADVQRRLAEDRAGSLLATSIAALGKEDPGAAMARVPELSAFGGNAAGPTARQRLFASIADGGIPAFLHVLSSSGIGIFSPDASELALLDSRGLTIVDPKSWKTLSSLTTSSPGAAGATGLQWMGPDRVVFSRTDDTVWLLADGRLTKIFGGHGMILDLDGRKDGSSILVACDDGTVWLLAGIDSKIHAVELAHHDGRATAVRFGEGTAISTGADGHVIISHLTQTNMVERIQVSPAGITDIAWAGDDHRTLLLGDGRGTIFSLDLGTPDRHITEISHQLSAPVARLLVSPHGALLALGSDFTMLKIDNFRDQASPKTVVRNVTAMSFGGPSDDWLVLGFGDGTISIQNLAQQLTLHIPALHERIVWVAIAATGEVAAFGEKGAVRGYSNTLLPVKIMRTPSKVTTLLSTASGRVVGALASGQLITLDAAQHEASLQLRPPVVVRYSTNGDGFLVADDSGTVSLLDVDLSVHSKWPLAASRVVDIRASSHFLAVADTDGAIKVIGVTGVSPAVRTISPRGGKVSRIRFVDDTHLLVGYGDGAVLQLDLDSLIARPILPADGRRVVGLGVDNDRAIVLSLDGGIREILGLSKEQPDTAVLRSSSACEGHSLRLVESKDRGLFVSPCGPGIDVFDLKAGTQEHLAMGSDVMDVDSSRGDDAIAISTDESVALWTPRRRVVIVWPIAGCDDVEYVATTHQVTASCPDAIVALGSSSMYESYRY
jgi:WD40 repeat protein